MIRFYKDYGPIVTTQINRDGQIRTHTLGKKKKKSYGSERFARNPTRELKNQCTSLTILQKYKQSQEFGAKKLVKLHGIKLD